MSTIQCFYCEEFIHNSYFAKHLKEMHDKTLEEHALARAGYQDGQYPKCLNCGQPALVVKSRIYTFCSNPECKKIVMHNTRSAVAHKTLTRLSAEGKNPLQKQNRPIDADGKDSYARRANLIAVKNGTNRFLASNRPRDEYGNDLLAKANMQKKLENGTFNFSHANRKYDDQGRDLMVKAQIERGTFHYLSKNRPHDEFGRDLFSLKGICNRYGRSMEQAQLLLNKDFLLEKFVQNGYFNVYAMCRYFNCCLATANSIKIRLGIDVPNITTGKKRHEQNQVKYYFKHYDFEVESDTRKIITPLELDLYSKKYKLAIEYDGLYWHSNIEPDYHVQKTMRCEQQNLQLLHIFSNEWQDPVKKKIWKSVIRSKLGKNHVIYARNCTIRSGIDCAQFLNENHLQGSVPASISYGLYYHEKLLAVMTFGKSRFDKTYEYELLRFCTQRGVQIVGGASKLIKYFINDYHPRSILSYANRRWSNGKLYEALGFQKIGVTEPNYFYTKDCIVLLNRIQCQKHKLKDLLGDSFNPELTECENMFNAGYRIVYDCGNIKYALVFN